MKDYSKMPPDPNVYRISGEDHRTPEEMQISHDSNMADLRLMQQIRDNMLAAYHAENKPIM